MCNFAFILSIFYLTSIKVLLEINCILVSVSNVCLIIYRLKGTAGNNKKKQSLYPINGVRYIDQTTPSYLVIYQV